MAQQFRAARCAGCGWHAPRTVFNSLKSPLVVSFRHRGTTATTAAAAADAPAAAGLPPDGPAAAEPLLLDSLRVVLVAPKTAANIGAVARVCGNFETTNLCIVAPRCDPHDGEVYRLACGEAVLQRLLVVDTLEEALADTVGSIGFTRRAGATRYTHPSLPELLERFSAALPALDAAATDTAGQPPGVAALVFGREESGLTEDELRMCAHACAIPTGRLQPSMNLSHAVAVVLAFAFERRLQLLGLSDLGVEDPGRRSDTATRASTQPAAHSELAALLDKLSAIATAAGVSGEDSRGGGAQGRHGRRRLPVGHARALLGRSAASTAEVRALHGLASSVLAALQPGAGDPKDSIGGLDEGRHDTGGT